MEWLEGWPRVMAVVAASAAAGVAALLVARFLRLDRLFSRIARTGLASPEKQVETLAALADLALREGMLSLESRAAQTLDDFLIRAVALAVDGAHPDEIRRQMEPAIDASGIPASPVKRFILRLAHVPQIPAILGAAILVGIMAVCGPDSASATPAAAGVLLFVLGLATGALVGPAADRVAGRQAALIMMRMMQAEAIASIRSGCDGRAVAAKLRGMLPGRSEVARPAARAA